MPDEPVRLTRGQLEAEVIAVTDRYANGDLDTSGQPLTSHRIASAIVAARGDSDDRRPPSTGAIADNLKRWGEIGFAVVGTGPLAFQSYTPEAASEGLANLKQKYGEKQRAEKKAAAASTEPEPAADEPEGEPAAAPPEPDHEYGEVETDPAVVTQEVGGVSINLNPGPPEPSYIEVEAPDAEPAPDSAPTSGEPVNDPQPDVSYTETHVTTSWDAPDAEPHVYEEVQETS